MYGTPTMMLGRLGAAIPAGMGPQPWAGYPGVGGDNVLVPVGSRPSWNNNFITSPVALLPEDQNRQRVFNGGAPLSQSAAGSSYGRPIYGTNGFGGPLVQPWAGNQSSFTMGVGCSRCVQPLSGVILSDDSKDGYLVGGLAGALAAVVARSTKMRWGGAALIGVGVAVAAKFATDAYNAKKPAVMVPSTPVNVPKNNGPMFDPWA